MQKELAIAKELINKDSRLSLVVLDNIVELNLFELIQANAMFDYLERDNSNNAKYRIGLYSNFADKIKYAIKKNIIDKYSGDLFNQFHKIRNNIYHKAENNDLSLQLANHYYLIIESYLAIRKSESIFLYNESNKICEILKTNLQNRFIAFRANIAEACASSRDFDSLELTDEEINFCMDHVFANYGERTIEKSNLKKELKELYINNFMEHQVSENLFFKIENLYSLEKRVHKHKWNEDLKGLITWYEIDNEFKIYEEIIELYVNIAC